MALTKETIIPKIRKLLSLAGDDPTSPEEQTAHELALKLCHQYGITLREVEDEEQREKNLSHVSEIIRREDEDIDQWELELAFLIADYYECVIVVYDKTSLKRVEVVGTKEYHPKIKTMFSDFLQAMLEKCLDNAERQRKDGNTDWSESFIIGYLDSVKRTFQEYKTLGKRDDGFTVRHSGENPFLIPHDDPETKELPYTMTSALAKAEKFLAKNEVIDWAEQNMSTDDYTEQHSNVVKDTGAYLCGRGEGRKVRVPQRELRRV